MAGVGKHAKNPEYIELLENFLPEGYDTCQDFTTGEAWYR